MQPNNEIVTELGFRIVGLRYKIIISHCSSGNVKREDLISEWHVVRLSDGSTTEAYHHKFHGWMQIGESQGLFIYGYVPLKNVTNWKEK